MKKTPAKTAENIAAGIFEKLGIDPGAFAASIDGLVVADGGTMAVGNYFGGVLTDWQKVRLGKITGSCFNKVTWGRGGKGWSETAKSYMYDLVGEWITGLPASEFSGSRATDWGHQHEEMAIVEYQARTRRKLERGKFYKAKQFELVGCTPDGVGNIGLEVKCPYSFKNHLRTAIERQVPSEYEDQVFGHMLVTGRKKCSYVSFDPRIERKDLRLVVIDVEWEQNKINSLSERLSEFEKDLIEILERLEIDYKK